MTSSVARRMCNSDGVFYRHSSRHTGVFVCLSLSVSAQYFGGEGLVASHTGKTCALREQNPNLGINLIITVIIIRIMMVAMIMY